MLRLSARIALALTLLAAAPAAAPADPAPAGQFVPSLGDRDGDGLPDAADCAADDPSRPSRAGTDLDCDGAPDAGSGIAVGILGPADGAPDPGDQQVASTPSSGTVATKAAARRAAGEPVRAVRLRLGPSVAVYAPSHARRSAPAIVLAAKGNVGVTVRPVAVVGGRTRALPERTRSIARGRAFVVRVRTPRGATLVRFRVVVVDAQGDRYAAVRSVRV